MLPTVAAGVCGATRPRRPRTICERGRPTLASRDPPEHSASSPAMGAGFLLRVLECEEHTTDLCSSDTPCLDADEHVTGREERRSVLLHPQTERREQLHPPRGIAHKALVEIPDIETVQSHLRYILRLHQTDTYPLFFFSQPEERGKYFIPWQSSPQLLVETSDVELYSLICGTPPGTGGDS